MSIAKAKLLKKFSLISLALFFCLFTFSSAFAQSFSDVPPDYWAYNQIEALKTTGIVAGYSDGTYHPEEQVNRAQMAVFIQRAKGLPLYTGSQLFPDVPVGYWAFGQIGACYQDHIVGGYTDGTYKPEAVVTRDQMAVFLCRAAKLDTSIYDPANSATWAVNFTDVPITNWAWKEIQAVAGAQVAFGFSPTTYAPTMAVTRAQMAVFMCRAFNVKAVETTDITPPSTNITSPANGATVANTVSIQASGSDNVAVMKLGFYLDDVLVLTDVKTPYEYNWDTKDYSDGAHTLKVIAYDTSYNSATTQISITVDNSNSLKILSITPADGSNFLAGAGINIQPSVQNPQSRPLQYQFSIGGTIKQVWSSTSSYPWQTTASDTGTVSVKCEVRDDIGGSDFQTLTYRILNPTIAQILQKLADNYALIQDFKADMVLSSTLDGSSFGQTEYCRYYFKAPGKEKTESFTDFSRATKTEAIIIDSSNMYLIDTVRHIIQPVDLLAEAGINSTQFSQMDLYYNQANFLSNHTVTANSANTDYVNCIVALDAIPKVANTLYTKLELYIDYNKGLMVKLVHRKNDELPQSVEAIETKQMVNGAWATSKFRKVPNLTAGNFIVTINYDNLQVNTGLTDQDFDPTKQY